MDEISELPIIDVVIPTASKDADGLDACIASVVKHCRNPIRTIQLVADFSKIPDAGSGMPVRRVDERTVTPGTADISEALAAAGHRHSNASWYFQQLLKLRCFELPGSISATDAGAGGGTELSGADDGTPHHVLVIDADFALVDDLVFVDAEHRSQLAMGYPLHWELGTGRPALPPRHSALSSAARLVPGWQPVDAYSGMQHHMVFDRMILADLIHRVEREHRKPFWRSFLTTVEPGKWTGASEYVLYRHFACRFFPERVTMRHLSAVDVIQAEGPGAFSLPQALEAPRPAGFQAVGCHRFLNYSGRLATMDYIPDELRREITATSQPLKLCLRQGELTIASAMAPLTLP
ncbi:MAG: hypothetical protein QOD82_7422 [Pseudonocardiales bacterium]|nr:hypothetical protein [Pseudonocardiales bacterium]